MPEGAKQVRRKSTLWKWLLGCGCLALVLCGLGVGIAIYYVSQSFTTDPAKANAIAQTMVGFDVPEGYRMKMGANFFGMKFAVFGNAAGDDKGLVCTIMRFPKSLNLKKADMEVQMNSQLQKRGGSGQVQVESSETVKMEVGSDEMEADSRIVTDQKSGKKMRQYLLFLDRQDGMVMLQMMGPEDDFDMKAMTSFLGSIR